LRRSAEAALTTPRPVRGRAVLAERRCRLRDAEVRIPENQALKAVVS